MYKFGSVLTLWHHGQREGLVGVGLKHVVGVNEPPVEDAQIGSRVVEGHVVDVDGAVLQVLGVVAAFPAQAAEETWVNDFLSFVFVVVQLEQNHRLDRQ